MELPQVMEHFIEAQHKYDGKAFAECFTQSAIVHDQGKTHTGRKQIQHWIEQSMKVDNSRLETLDYQQSESNAVLTAKVTGTFPQSPIVLKFNFVLKDGLIDSLKVTE